MRNPHTRAEWQQAVDAAAAVLLIEATREFGLISGGPDVNTERCYEILDRGRQLGITRSVPPTELALAYIEEWNERHGLTDLEGRGPSRL